MSGNIIDTIEKMDWNMYLKLYASLFVFLLKISGKAWIQHYFTAVINLFFLHLANAVMSFTFCHRPTTHLKIFHYNSLGYTQITLWIRPQNIFEWSYEMHIFCPDIYFWIILWLILCGMNLSPVQGTYLWQGANVPVILNCFYV